MSEQQKYIIKDTLKEGEFNLREWTAPELTSPFECQEYMDNLNLKGRKIKQIKMIGLNYMHVREWIENKAYLLLENVESDETERQKQSDYKNIVPDMLFDRYAQIDEPIMIEFEDGDRLELLSPLEGRFQASINHIPWNINNGINDKNEDANILFSDCIGQVICSVKVYASENDENYIDRVELKFENGGGLCFYSECFDYCGVISINANNKVSKIPFCELKKGLFNREDLMIDEVTGFEASTRTFYFGEKGREHIDTPYLTVSPSDTYTEMYIYLFDFLLFELSIVWLKRNRFSEYENYQFSFSQWNELLSIAERILNYNSFDDLFDDMERLNIFSHNGKVNIPLSIINNRGVELWKNKSRYQTQLSDMREWTKLVLKENDTMNIYGW